MKTLQEIVSLHQEMTAEYNTHTIAWRGVLRFALILLVVCLLGELIHLLVGPAPYWPADPIPLWRYCTWTG